jgi:hypothetical protein
VKWRLHAGHAFRIFPRLKYEGADKGNVALEVICRPAGWTFFGQTLARAK